MYSGVIYICFCRLAYLHEDIEPKVFHRSLISSNVLLDHQWDPKISDFGLAKLYSPAWGITIMESLGSVSLLPSKTYIYMFDHFHCWHIWNLILKLHECPVMLLRNMLPLVILLRSRMFIASEYLLWRLYVAGLLLTALNTKYAFIIFKHCRCFVVGPLIRE